MACNRVFIRTSVVVTLSIVALYGVASAWGAGGFAATGRGGYGAAHAQGQGYLGILFHDVNENEIAPMHLKDGHGAEIIMVDHDGPAGKAGLREHDVVLSANGIPVEGEEHLRKLLHDLAPGRSVSMVVCRNGAEQTINAVMANREEVERQAWQQHSLAPASSRPMPDDTGFPPVTGEPAPSTKTGFGHSFIPGHLLSLAPPYTGMTVDALGAQLADFFGVKDGKGLLVHEVEVNSPAAAAGLHAGDVVTRVNGDAVATEKDWGRALHNSKGRSLSLTVVRDRKEQVLTMVPDSRKRGAVDKPAGSQANSRIAMSLR
jgi:serine protease Do